MPLQVLSEEASPPLMALGLGEVGSATPLSFWSALYSLGSEWQAVVCSLWESCPGPGLESVFCGCMSMLQSGPFSGT